MRLLQKQVTDCNKSVFTFKNSYSVGKCSNQNYSFRIAFTVSNMPHVFTDKVLSIKKRLIIEEK